MKASAHTPVHKESSRWLVFGHSCSHVMGCLKGNAGERVRGRSWGVRQTDRQIDGERDRQTDGERERLGEVVELERQTDRRGERKTGPAMTIRSQHP